MEAKEHLTVDDCLNLYEEEGIMGLVEKVKEISFKAGAEETQNRLHSTEVLGIVEEALQEARQAGIREVVEKVDKHFSEYAWMGNEDWKQVKLKEWGIKEDNNGDKTKKKG